MSKFGAWPLGLLLLSCQSEPADAEGEAVPFRVSVLEVTPCPVGPEIDATKIRVVGIKVRVESHHAAGVAANYFYGSALTTDQARYLAEQPGCSPLLRAAPLRPGERAEGFLNFPVPVGKTLESLAYAPEVPGLRASETTVEVPLQAGPLTRPTPEDE